MEIYKEEHRGEPHYHLGSGSADSPNDQNKIFEKIIELLNQNLPDYLWLRFNQGYSVNVMDEGNRTYLYLSCYKQHMRFPFKWRVKIIVFDRGEKFFKEVFVPLVKSI